MTVGDKFVEVLDSNGKFHCIALVVDDINELLAKNVCSQCGYKGAIKWNPFNKIHQCHNCGQAFAEEETRVRVQFT